MTIEKIIVGEDEVSVEVKPITLIFNHCFRESAYPERTMITPEMSLDYFRGMEEIDPFTARFFSIVIPDFPLPIDKKNLEKCQVGFQQVVGMMGLSLNLLLQKKKFGWKYPESNLHPKYQLNLAEALMVFSNPNLFIKTIEEIKENMPVDSTILKASKEEIEKAKSRLKK
jgi:hypothetical protein